MIYNLIYFVIKSCIMYKAGDIIQNIMKNQVKTIVYRQIDNYQNFRRDPLEYNYTDIDIDTDYIDSDDE